MASIRDFLSVLLLTTGAHLLGCGEGDSDATTTNGTGGTAGSATGGAASGGAASGGMASGGSAGEGGAPQCPSGSVCRAGAPEGWSGPLAFYAGSADGEPPSCPDGLPDLVLDAFDGATGAPASCSCDCEAPSGGCTGNVSWSFASMSSSGTCSLCDGIMGSNVNTCLPTGGACSSGGFPSGVLAGNVATNPGAAACAPIDTVELPPPGAWSIQARACGTSTAGEACDEGSCVAEPPAPFGALHCIAKEGDHSCPSGPYSLKQLVFQSMVDSRGCAPCTCGAASGAACSTKLEIFDSGNCSNLLQSTGPTGCHAWPAGSSSMKFTSTLVGGSCPPSPGTPTGELEASEPTTVCCME